MISNIWKAEITVIEVDRNLYNCANGSIILIAKENFNITHFEHVEWQLA
jgi:hypothetical protein